MIKFKNRDVEIIEWDGIDHSDAPKYCDAHVTKALWADSGDQLTNLELDEMSDSCACELYEELWSYLH